MSNKITFNMFDHTIYADSFVESNMRAGGPTYANFTKENQNMPGELRKPKLVSYTKEKANWNGVTIFTDKVLQIAPQVKSRFKVAVMVEPRELLPQIYDTVITVEDEYDLIFTHEKSLLERNPDKYVFFPPDCSGIDDKSCKIHEKTKLISMVYSDKTWMFGHRLRHIIAKDVLKSGGFDEIVDFYGTGPNNPIRFKSEGLNDYMFSIAIENAKKEMFFCDKIMDCLITGTVPIYWGAPDISKYFDERGILSFNTPDELKNILEEISEKKYKSMLKYIKKNYEICKNDYLNFDDNLAKEIKERLL